MKNVLLSGLLLLALDISYLTVTKSFYSKQLTVVQKSPVNFRYSSAILTYIVIIFAINYFIIANDASIYDAFLLGFSIYAIFELTNYTLFTKWRINTVIIDTLWGGILFATVTALMKTFNS